MGTETENMLEDNEYPNIKTNAGTRALDVERLVMRKCAACGTEKPLAEMRTCMHNQMHRYVCDMECMIKFYT